MAISYMCGFELGTQYEMSEAPASCTVSFVGRNQGYGLKYVVTGSPGSASHVLRRAGGTTVNYCQSYTIYIKVVSYATSTGLIGIGTNDSVGLNASRQIIVYNTSGTIRATSTVTWPTDGLYHKLDVNSNGADSYILLDGVNILQYSGLSTPGTIKVGGQYWSGAAEIHYDDLVCYDGPLPADRPSEYTLTLLKPVADGPLSLWRRNDSSTATGLYTAVDNTPPTGTAATSTLGTNYIQNAVAGSGVTSDNVDLTCMPYTYAIAPLLIDEINDIDQAGTPLNTTVAGFGLQRTYASNSRLAGVVFKGYIDNSSGSTLNVDLIAEIQTIDGPSYQPTGTVLGSGSIPMSSLSIQNTSFGTPERVEIMLDTPITLSPGSQYGIVLRPSVAGSNVLWVTTVTSFNRGYNVGFSWVRQSGAWQSMPGETLAFAPIYDSLVYGVMPIINDAQQVTTGSPKSGTINALVQNDVVITASGAPGTVGEVGHATSTMQRAQSFIANGPTKSVSLFGAYVGSIPGDYVIELRSDSNGQPGTEVLAGPVDFQFTSTSGADTTTALSYGTIPGNVYWVVLRRTGAANATVYLSWYNTVSNVYSGGTGARSDGTNWIIVSHDQMLTVKGAYSPQTTFDFGLPNGTSGSTTATAQGAFPIGWGTHAGGVLDTSALELPPSSAPIVRVRRTGTYTRVISVDAAGVYALTGTPPPEAPTNLTATGTANSIMIDWDAPTAGISPDSYKVYRIQQAWLTGDDSTFDSSIGSWRTVNSAVSWDSTAQALTVSATGGNFISAISEKGPIPTGAATVDASIKIKWKSGTPRSMRAQVRFYNASNVELDTFEIGTTIPNTNNYTTLATTSIAVPATATQIDFTTTLTGGVTVAGESYNVDDATVTTSALIATVSAPTTQHEDTTAVLETEYAYYVKSAISGTEGPSSDTVTGTMGVSMIEYVGIPI